MRIRGKAPVKAPLLLWDLHSSSRDEWELDWRKRDGRAFLAMRLMDRGPESFKSELVVLRNKE